MKNYWRRGTLWGLLALILCPVFLNTAQAQEKEILPQPGKPLTLEQCVALAMRFNPALRSNQAVIEAQKARVEQALAAYYPQVNFNMGYNASTSNFTVVSGTVFRQPTRNYTFVDIFSMGPNLSQTIYDFGRTASNVNINRENVKASEHDLATTRQNVVLNVKQAYFGALQNQRLIEVAQDVVNRSKLQLEQAKGFYQAGTRPKIDVTKAEVDLANADLAVIRARNNYAVSRVNLNNAMGLTETLSFPIEDIPGFTPMRITLEEILRAAYQKRPEILQLKAKQRSQESAIDLAASSYYPVLSGNVNYLWRSQHIGNDLYWDWTVGATLSIPLFSGFSSPNQVAEQRANLRNLVSQEETLKLNIRLEAEQAFLGLKEAEERIRVTEKTVVQAQENYDLASGRYQVGVGNPLEVTDAEVSLANAKANHIQALYDYKVSEARIEKAMGEGR